MRTTLSRHGRPRRSAHLLAAVAVAAAGVVTFAMSGSVSAAPPTLNAPERLYTGVDETLAFDGSTDAVSGGLRQISVAVTIAGCNNGGPNYSVSGCGRIQMSLNDSSDGRIFIAGLAQQTKPDTTEVLVHSGGAVIDVATNADGSPGYVYHVAGTTAQINDALSDLSYIPAAGWESGNTDGPHANLNLVTVNGSLAGETTNRDVQIRIEGDNGAPVLGGDAGPLKASISQATSFPADANDPPVVSFTDPELCTFDLCGGGYTNQGVRDNDDKVLVVAWLSACTNSSFHLRGGAFTTTGSPTLPDVHEILTHVSGLGLENDQAAAIEAVIPSTLVLDFTGQQSGPTADNTVFAGVGEFDEVQYALDQITFDTTKNDDTTCTFNVVVTDLGNNGMPLGYVGSPIGGPLVNPEPGYEVPDAKAAARSIQVKFGDTNPDTTVSTSATNPTNDATIPFTVTFEEAMSTAGADAFASGDVSVTNGSVQGFSTSDDTTFTFDVAPAGDGDVTVAVAAGVAKAADDDSANDASNQVTVEYDGSAPSATIDQAGGQSDPTSASPILFALEFSEDVTGVDDGDVALTGSTAGAGGTAAGLVADVTPVDGDSYLVAVSGMVTNLGVVVATVGGGAAQDAAGNGSGASTSLDNSVTWNTNADGTPPTVTVEQKAGQADPTSASPIRFTVDFSEQVSGFTSGDVTLSASTAGTGGTAAGLSASVSTVDAPTGVYEIAVTGMSTNGFVIASIGAGKAFDLAANPNLASTSADNTVQYSTANDQTSPSVTIDQKSSAPAQADPTHGAQILYAVHFGEPVTGFTGGDVSFAGSTAGAGGGATGLAAAVSGSGANYTVTVTGMATSGGHVGVAIGAGAAKDAANNDSLASTSTDNTVTWDTTAPSIDTFTGPGTANTSPILVNIVFTEPVSGFTGSDVDLSASTAGGALVAAVNGSGAAYQLSITEMTTDGNVVVKVKTGSVIDAAGNVNGANPSSVTVVWNAGAADITNPTVVVTKKLSSPAQPDPTNVGPVRFTVTFSEPVTGVDTGDLSLTVTGTVAGASVASVTPVSTSIYTVDVNPGSGEGTIGLNVVTGGGIVDGSSNPLLAGASTVDTVAFDSVTPTVQTLVKSVGQADPTSTSPISFRVTFSEPVTGFTASDVDLSASGAGGSLVASRTVVSSTVYDITVAGMTTSGTVVVGIKPNGVLDVAGNTNAASATTAAVAWSQPGDATKPGVSVAKAPSQPDPTTALEVTFHITFTEPVVGFTASAVQIGGTASPTNKVVAGSLDTYTVTVSGMNQSGTVTLAIPANVVKDNANNWNTGSGAAVGVQWVLDTTKPSVTMEQGAGQADPTSTGPIVFTATFDEPVSGFTSIDVVLSGTAGATTALVTGGPTTFTISVSGMGPAGTVIATIPAGAAEDAATNTSNASTSTDNSVTWIADAIAPDVTIEQAAGQADPTSGTTIQFTATFSEPVTGFTTGDVTIGGTASATAAEVSGSGATYTVTVSGMSVAGTVTAAIGAGVVIDGAGNANDASTSSDNLVAWTVPIGPDTTAPTVTVDQAMSQSDPASGATVSFTAIFSEPVTGFAAGDVAIGGTAGATTAEVSGGPAVYNVSVGGMTATGTITVSVPAGAAVDGAGNPNTASISSDNTVSWAAVSPTVVVPTANGDVGLSVAAGSQLLSFTTSAPVVPAPYGVSFPYGQLSFTASTTPGSLVTFSLVLPSVPSSYYKLVGSVWLPFAWDGETGARINGTVVTITIRDNGRGDSDLTPGIVTDPGAPGFASLLPATGTDTPNRLLWPAGMLLGAGLILVGSRRRLRRCVTFGA